MAGLKLDGAGVQKLKTLEDATTMVHRLNGIVETYALALKRAQPTMSYGMQIKRSLPPLVGLLKGQFGMIAEQVASLNLVVTRGANEQTRIRVLREGVGSIRQALEIAAQRVKENHAEKHDEVGDVERE
jgi:hypothetical protein